MMWMLFLKVSLVIFIIGNLLEMGLKLNPVDILKGLKDYRFVANTLVWGFVVGPLLAVGITKIIPLEEPYALGLILLGMAPSAPFLPLLVARANADRGYTAAFMFLIAFTTVLFMPVVVPVVTHELSVTAWTIAKPLLLIILLPMITGMFLLRKYKHFSVKIIPVVKKVTVIFAVTTLTLSVVVFYDGILDVSDVNVFLAQLLFFAFMMLLPYWFSLGLNQEHRVIISIGMATRNLGAAVAPLISIATIDQRAFIMIVLAVPFMLGFALLSAKLFGFSKVEAAQL